MRCHVCIEDKQPEEMETATRCKACAGIWAVTTGLDPAWLGVKNPSQPTDTQVNAALMAYPKSGTARRRVLEFIEAHHGATDDEVQVGLGMNPNTQRPRRVELVEGGFIRDSGQRRKTQGGADAIVWKATGEVE